MRGKAKSVLVSLENKYEGVRRFVSFTRQKTGDTRSFYELTDEQIARVARVVNRMSREGKLRLHVHTWGWAGCREGTA